MPQFINIAAIFKLKIHIYVNWEYYYFNNYDFNKNYNFKISIIKKIILKYYDIHIYLIKYFNIRFGVHGYGRR